MAVCILRRPSPLILSLPTIMMKLSHSPPPTFNLFFFFFITILAASMSPWKVKGVVTTIKIKNGCSYIVWPGLLTGSSTPPTTMSDGRSPTGFKLNPGESDTIELPHGWSGRLWGRTGCNFSSDGIGTCQSGDCGGKLDCSGAGATPPATLVEFTIQSERNNKDFYDVSIVDGSNVPITVTPGGTIKKTNQSSTSCVQAGCTVDLNKICPSQLQVMAGGRVVACKSACLALQSDQYCCKGAFANSNTCKPTNYSRIFKTPCPQVYTYAFDDPSSLYTCSASNYTIAFCSSTKAATPTSIATNKGPWKLWACIGISFLLSMAVKELPWPQQNLEG
eukprot:c33407_g1_i1 orf=35-1036(+)